MKWEGGHISWVVFMGKQKEDIGEQIIKAQTANLCLRATIGKVGRNEVVTIIEYHDNTHIHWTVESGNWKFRKREDHKENLVGRITLFASCGLEWSQTRCINTLILGHAYSIAVFFSISLVSRKGHMTFLVNELWLEMCHSLTFWITICTEEVTLTDFIMNDKKNMLCLRELGGYYYSINQSSGSQTCACIKIT